MTSQVVQIARRLTGLKGLRQLRPQLTHDNALCLTRATTLKHVTPSDSIQVLAEDHFSGQLLRLSPLGQVICGFSSFLPLWKKETKSIQTDIRWIVNVVLMSRIASVESSVLWSLEIAWAAFFHILSSFSESVWSLFSIAFKVGLVACLSREESMLSSSPFSFFTTSVDSFPPLSWPSSGSQAGIPWWWMVEQKLRHADWAFRGFRPWFVAHVLCLRLQRVQLDRYLRGFRPAKLKVTRFTVPIRQALIHWPDNRRDQNPSSAV